MSLKPTMDTRAQRKQEVDDKLLSINDEIREAKKALFKVEEALSTPPPPPVNKVQGEEEDDDDWMTRVGVERAKLKEYNAVSIFTFILSLTQYIHLPYHLLPSSPQSMVTTQEEKNKLREKITSLEGERMTAKQELRDVIAMEKVTENITITIIIINYTNINYIIINYTNINYTNIN